MLGKVPNENLEGISGIILTTRLFILKINSRKDDIRTTCLGVYFLQYAIWTISNFIVYSAAGNLQVYISTRETFEPYLSKGVSALNTAGARIVSQELICCWPSTTCIAIYYNVSIE